MKKLYWVICSKNRKFKSPKTSYLLGKTVAFSLFAVSARIKRKKYLKKNQMRY